MAYFGANTRFMIGEEKSTEALLLSGLAKRAFVKASDSPIARDHVAGEFATIHHSNKPIQPGTY